MWHTGGESRLSRLAVDCEFLRASPGTPAGLSVKRRPAIRCATSAVVSLSISRSAACRTHGFGQALAMESIIVGWRWHVLAAVEGVTVAQVQGVMSTSVHLCNTP